VGGGGRGGGRLCDLDIGVWGREGSTYQTYRWVGGVGGGSVMRTYMCVRRGQCDADMQVSGALCACSYAPRNYVGVLHYMPDIQVGVGGGGGCSVMRAYRWVGVGGSVMRTSMCVWGKGQYMPDIQVGRCV
jgi:hypothetical protein